MADKVVELSKDLVGYISSRLDGNMSFRWGAADEVLANREKFLAEIGLKLDQCVAMVIGHSAVVAEVDSAMRGRGMREIESAVSAEALVTSETGLGLFLVAADCLPVVYFDPVHRVLALAHMSWKSSNEEVAVSVVRSMVENHGSRPADVQIFLAAGAHRESYLVDSPTQLDDPRWVDFISKQGEGYSVDLYGFNTRRLIDAGILPENILISPVDTISDKKFFSHYRAKRDDSEKEGRHAIVIAIKESRPEGGLKGSLSV